MCLTYSFLVFFKNNRLFSEREKNCCRLESVNKKKLFRLAKKSFVTHRPLLMLCANI